MITILLYCLIILTIGYIYDREITTEEFITVFLVCVITALITYGITWLISIGPNDVYFESGKINQISYHPYFKERYKQRHEDIYPCGTDRNGYVRYCTKVYYTTEYDYHKEYWYATDTLNQGQKISKSTYELIAKDFGNNLKVDSSRSRYYHSDGVNVEGDSRLYYYNNETNTYKYPTNKLSRWYNPIKKSKSLFNTEKDDLLYPISKTWRETNRNITNEGFTQTEWDIFNTQLYEKVKVNIILIKISSINEAENIKYAWNSGKKNDIVICYEGDITNPSSVLVFGWYKTEVLSSTLETFVLNHGVTKNSLNGIKHIILSYYAPFNFKEFNYITKPPELWQIVVTSLVTGFIMILLYLSASTNEYRR